MITKKTQKHYFHDVARSERYFTATILPHLLMSDSFSGTKLLFKHIFGENFTETDDFEIVTELDPVRDGSVYNSDIRIIFKETGRIAVPDIFIRWGTTILAIEAKFFTQPSSDELQDQLKLQWDAISSIISNTHYDLNKIHQCLLMIKEPDGSLQSGIVVLSWSSLHDLLIKNRIDKYSNDCAYSMKILQASILRAQNELAKSSKITFTKVKDIDTLIMMMHDLIKNGKIWVGFSEGMNLVNLDLKYLLERKHYKVSDKQYTPNWIRIDLLISKYLNLKFPQSNQL